MYLFTLLWFKCTLLKKSGLCFYLGVFLSGSTVTCNEMLWGNLSIGIHCNVLYEPLFGLFMCVCWFDVFSFRCLKCISVCVLLWHDVGYWTKNKKRLFLKYTRTEGSRTSSSWSPRILQLSPVNQNADRKRPTWLNPRPVFDLVTGF